MAPITLLDPTSNEEVNVKYLSTRLDSFEGE